MSVRGDVGRGKCPTPQVYCVSLDASKAFDRVIHSGLFVKLAKRGNSFTIYKDVEVLV